ncbi:MAG: nucleotidyl transferase AbiEii/AbiGii toxin family protein [Planctomycetaceae bacterium]
MKIDFLALPDDERRLYIEQAAIRRSLSPVIMEKDFWVCWLLGILFESEFAGDLVFKGGTSLSKVFGVIDRFSEDIDLSLSPQFLNLPEAGKSRTRANKWMAKAEAACGQAVQSLIAPVLEAAAHETLGDRGEAWFEFLTDPATHSPVLLFHYPSTQPDGIAYLKRSVKLEFGSLTDQQPTGRHPVAPWIADVLPEAFPDWKCEVVALEVQRTFWEKATILHTEFHRPADKPTPDRFSPLRRYGRTGNTSRCEQSCRGPRSTQPGRALEEPVLRQFMGKVRRGGTRIIPPRAAASKASFAEAGLPGDARHVPLGASKLRRHPGALSTLEGRINGIAPQDG